MFSGRWADRLEKGGKSFSKDTRICWEAFFEKNFDVMWRSLKPAVIRLIVLSAGSRCRQNGLHRRGSERHPHNIRDWDSSPLCLRIVQWIRRSYLYSKTSAAVPPSMLPGSHIPCTDNADSAGRKRRIYDRLDSTVRPGTWLLISLRLRRTNGNTENKTDSHRWEGN